jgi:hypothetical protein
LNPSKRRLHQHVYRAVSFNQEYFIIVGQV